MSSRNQLGGAHRPVAEKPEPAAAGVFAVEKQIVVHAQLANQRQILEHSLDAVLACVLHRTEPNLLALKIDAATVRRFAVRSERSCYNQCRRSIRYAKAGRPQGTHLWHKQGSPSANDNRPTFAVRK